MDSDSNIIVSLKNCNNILDCNIEIEEKYLNLKYAMNGTGKSSISKALELFSKGKSLDDLNPFSQCGKPEVTINKQLNNVLIFDENFIKNVVFKDENVIENSFEIGRASCRERV